MQTIDGAPAPAKQADGTATWVLASAGALVFYLVSMRIGFNVFAVDYYVGPLLCYLALALMSVGTTAVCEAFYDALDSSKTLLRRNHLALMLAGGLLLTAVYGPRIFIKFYEYDDWIYMPYRFTNLDWDFLGTPINYHYMPVLKLILYYVSKYSDPTYFGNAMVFYLASMLVLSGLSRVVKTHAENSKILILAVISFAIWPSFDASRIAFNGGFWLAFPVAMFLGLLLVVRAILLDSDSGLRNYIPLALLTMATVLSSSQILIPLLYIFVYLLAYWNVAHPLQRSRLYRKGMAISVILLLPTIVAFSERSHLLQAAPNFSGLFDGAYLTNLALFIKAKVGFEKISTTVLVCVVLYFGIRSLRMRFRTSTLPHTSRLLVFVFALTAWGLTMPKMGFNEVTAPFWIVGLLIFGGHAFYGRIRSGRTEQDPNMTPAYAMMWCGLAMLLFFVLQVGVGRRWSISTALADYYAMFPLTGSWLFAAGFMAIYHRSTCTGSTSPATPLRIHRSTGGLGLARPYFTTLIVSAALGVTFIYSVEKYYPTEKYVGQVMAQKRFIRDLGLAACSEAKTVSENQRLFLLAKYPFMLCKTCGELLRGPESFVIAMSEGGDSTGGYFQFLGKISAMELCPDVSGRLVFTRAEATRVSDGESEDTARFYRKYYNY